MSETRREDTALSNQPAPVSRPAERSNGESAGARMTNRWGDPLRLNDEQWEEFVRVMLNPAPPSQRMIEAARRHREYVVATRRLVDGCGSGMESPESGSVPNAAAGNERTHDGGKTKFHSRGKGIHKITSLKRIPND